PDVCSSDLHLALVKSLFKEHERRDPEEVLGTVMPASLRFASQRDFVRSVLASEIPLRSKGSAYVPQEEESQASIDTREALNASGSPSSIVSAGYQWTPGTERSEEHTSELQSREKLVCRLLLEKK